MALLDQLMTLPDRQVVRVKKAVLPWVKITPTQNVLKPKVQLSTSAVELIASENSYIQFRELNGSLYITTPSPWSAGSDPNKTYDTRIGATNRLEITKAVINTWATDLSKYHGEYLLELVGESEVATNSGTNVLFKTFKLVSTNGNSNQSESEQLQTEDITDGLSHDESEADGSEYGLSDSISTDGGSDGDDLVLSEDSVF